MHGVVLRHSTLPGGGASSGGYDYDDGDTAVHEIGHYLGLYHTFQGGCTGDGDHIDDTPYEYDDPTDDFPAANNVILQCTSNRDTCPSQTGFDSIHNYMNYTDDPCMYEFTDDQIDRMETVVTSEKPSLGTRLYVPTDEYPTISSAINAAISGQTIVVFPDTYSESNNLTIATGVILEFAAGATLKMANGKKITVNGTLNALGTASDKITFKPISGTWYGIEVNSGGHFNPTHCNFEDVSLAIRYYGVSDDVFYCTFSGYSTAIKYDNYSGGRLANSSFIE